MANYRGIEVPDHLCGVLQYMENVDECREALQILSQQWDLLDVLSRVIETGTEVQQTRAEFRALNCDLISALADESLRKVVSGLAAKAQVTVDVIIRNLFERTADIGFLATDEDLRAFLLEKPGFTPDVIRSRLLEYQAKYSVYDNIVVLDTAGRVVASVTDDGLPEISSAPLLQEAMTSAEGYVETFAVSDLVPGEQPGLTYAYRIERSTAGAKSTLGVLVLVFGFDEEMQGIFGNLNRGDDWSVMTLLDKDGVVLASTDVAQVAVGTQLSVDADKEYQIVRNAGRRYIAATRQTKGYQGFYGLGWQGCALIPAELAFEQTSEAEAAPLEEHQFRAIAENKHLLSDVMREIPRRASEVQVELNRTVWNGHLVGSRSGADVSGIGQTVAQQTLLFEISRAGERTSRIFGEAVSALNWTAIGLIIEDCAFASALALDLMDRNLYERANDCRWWALTTQFREALANGNRSELELRGLTETLRYINGLYTVYTNLILFDQDGEILAVSNPAEDDLIGTKIDTELRSRITRVASTSYYGVSDFEATDLYDEEPTYVYGAPVHHPDHPSQVVGGIAIVFDSKPELPAMLNDAGPRDEAGELRQDCRMLYVDANRNIIASTSQSDEIGALLDVLPAEMLDIQPGQQTETVLVRDGAILAVSVSRSAGYREYKSAADKYQNTVYAVCLLKLGVDHAGQSKDQAKACPRFLPVRRDAKEVIELATFRIGPAWFALPSSDVIEAVTPDQIAGLPHTAKAVSGCIMYRGESVLLLNIDDQVSSMSSEKGAKQTAIVMRAPDGNLIGLEVDELGYIAKLDAAKLVDEHKATALSFANGIIPGDDVGDELRKSAAMMLVLDIPGILHAAGLELRTQDAA